MRTTQECLLMHVKAKQIRALLPLFLTLLVLFEMGAYATTITRPTERFFQFYVLGSDETAGNYFPNNSSLLQIGENVEWNLGVVNNMGLVQLVSIRVKLGNQSISAPNDTTSEPSPSPQLAEFKQFIIDNGTWIMPFTWQIMNYTIATDGQVSIHQISIANVPYILQDPPTCPGINSCSLRMIFELWTWNVDTSDFQIGWGSGDQRRIAWLQFWFNLAPGQAQR